MSEKVNVEIGESVEDGQKEVSAKKPVLLNKDEISDFAKTAFWAVLLAFAVRSVFLEPFHIPSGSMKPTLLVGDYLFVNKPAYGYSRYSFPFGVAPIDGRLWGKEPERGDVIVFALPTQPSVNYIKRLIGMPGDRIQVKSGRLYINDQIVPREFVKVEKIEEGGREFSVTQYLERLPGGVVHDIYEVSDQEMLDDTEVYTVPDGYYFMMGDNRDHSQDSRVSALVGAVPFENIVGRADFLFFSNNGTAQFYEFWKWPWAIRAQRLFQDIDPKRLSDENLSAQPVSFDESEE